MKNKKLSPFEQDTWDRIHSDPVFAETFFEELLERPISVQFGMMRRMAGFTQEKLARRAKLPQSFVSKLEKDGTDHYISVYIRLLRHVKSRLAIVPDGYKIVPAKAA